MKVGVRAKQTSIKFSKRRRGMTGTRFALRFQRSRPISEFKLELPLPTLILQKITAECLAFHEHHVLAVDFHLAIEHNLSRIVFFPFAGRGHVDDTDAGNLHFLRDGGVPRVPQPSARGALELQMKIALAHDESEIRAIELPYGDGDDYDLKEQ